MRQPQEFETYLRERCLVPELHAVSWVRVNRAGSNFIAHRHGAYEITCVVRGRMGHWIGERRFQAGAGEALVTPPGAPHGGLEAVLDRNEHGLVHVAFPRRGRALPGLEVRETSELAAAFAAMAPGVVPVPAEAPELIRRILEEHRAPQRPWARLRVRGALHQLLALLARAHGDAEARAVVGPVVRAALAWLESHLEEEVAFDALARRSGASPTHFRRLFLRETGQSPGDWLARRRVERAKELLASGRAVTAVAHRLGFSSSQYFATVFRRYTGKAPKDWRPASS